MTLEQKAKAYDEAVERARKLQENSNGMILKKWLWNIFPELKESEDERVRKDIIRFIQMEVEDEIVGNKWLAWLEKQVTVEEEDERIRKAIISGMKALQEKGKYTEFAHIPMDDIFAWLENQKAIKWGEEDKKMVDRLIRCCEKEHEELCNNRYGHQEIVSDLKRNCRERWDWLETLKQRMKGE